MENFTVNEENAQYIVQAFKNHYSNAKSIIRAKYPITDQQFLQLQVDFGFDAFTKFLPKEVKKPKFIKDRSELRKAGVFVDSENKAISYPFDKIKPEHEVYIKNLQSIGFTFQQATFLF